MHSISALIFTLLFITNSISSEANEPKSDELTLRNQLFADVFLLKEGVDRLQISVEVLNKRFSNQMEILRSLQSKMSSDDTDSTEEDSVCSRISSMFNTTIRKHNILESRLITKLEEMQEDQATRLEEILIKQKLNRNCVAQGATTATTTTTTAAATSSNTNSLLSTTLTEISEKIDKFEEKLSSQQQQLDKFISSQTKMLQDINDNFSKNQEQFEKISKDLTNLKELRTDVSKFVTHTRPKLPMEVIFGLTSANLTNIK